MKPWLRAERILIICGVTLLVAYVAIRVHGELYSGAAISSFKAAHATKPVQESPRLQLDSFRNADFSLWSEKRVEAYKQSLAQRFDQPLALLRISKIGLEVPVLDGTDDSTLNRGVGRIVGTSKPGDAGNTGIAGHRDGFFRGLKDVEVGDSVELATSSGLQEYVIDDIEIVNPKDVSVLKPTDTRSLTLVTCYPFYFIGSAPQRYIVHASIINSEPTRNASNIARGAVSKIDHQENTK